jgi:hypothetical protein
MPLPYYRIDLNEVPKSFANSVDEYLAVTPTSPLKLRREVERFAQYFRREFRYDFQQFEAIEKPKDQEKPYAAYLFTNKQNQYPRVWAGACCFRWREFKGVEPRWAMQWMWLHPYYRGKGILGRAWDKFHELHENFFCEPPFSPAMEAFLRKRGKCILCWQPLDMPEKVVCSRCEAQHKSR